LSTIEPILKDDYEVIVVGAGIGGLATAAVFAGSGLEVLLIEQSHVPGGCCSSFKAGDFTFDTAATVLSGFGEAGFHVLRTLFDSLNQQVELIPLDSAYRMYFGDQLIDFHADRQPFAADLGAIFPQQAGSILSFMRELDRVYQAILDASGPPRPPRDKSTSERWGLLTRHPLSMMRLSRYRRMSTEKVLRRYIDNPLALSFFEADLVYSTGYGTRDLSVIQAALSIVDRHVGGTHYPIGSSQQIPDRLEKSIVSHGGRIVFRVPVEEIIIKERRAAGVRIAGGRVLSARAVVSGISVCNVFGRLVASEHLRPETVKWATSLEPAPGVLAIDLGVPEAVIPDELKPDTVLIDDPERDPGDFISISVPSLLDPNLSPEGYHSVSIRAVADSGARPSPGDPLYHSEAYSRLEEEEADSVLSRVERVIPGVKEAMVERAVAGPAKFERYTGRPGGALAGPRVDGVPAPYGLPGAVTEIRGLFLAGDSTFYGRGVAQAAASGVNCALATLRYLGLHPLKFHDIEESPILETLPVRPQVSSEDVVDTISGVLESHRCLRCVDAPCRQGCPAGIDIPNFIRRVGAADFAGAARLIREANPLGGTCGQVCPAEELCQAKCRRAGVDSPVRIGQLEALVCGSVPGPEGWPEPMEGERRGKVAVIGSGPAGVSCAYFLSLLGHNVEIFEAGLDSGGLPAKAMPEFRLSGQALLREIEGALVSGIEFRSNTAFGLDINLDSLWREGFKAVFLGTGLQAMRMPAIGGIDLPGVIDAPSFLFSARRKVKRELTPRVAVLGDSELAIDTGMLTLTLGAEKVFLVTARKEKEITTAPGRVEEAREQGIEFVTGESVTRVLGEGRVEGLETEPSAGDSTPSPATGGKPPNVLKVKTIIVAQERELEKATLDYLEAQLKLNPDGTIPVDSETLATSRAGVFAGGDVTGGRNLVASACADGRRAAISIHRHLGSTPD